MAKLSIGVFYKGMQAVGAGAGGQEWVPIYRRCRRGWSGDESRPAGEESPTGGPPCATFGIAGSDQAVGWEASGSAGAGCQFSGGTTTSFFGCMTKCGDMICTP